MRRLPGALSILLMFFVCLMPAGIAVGADGGEDGKVTDLPQGERVVPATQEIVRKEARVQFSVRPLQGTEIMEGELVEAVFRISDANSGAPITSMNPAVWIDYVREGEGDKALSCNEKIRVFLQGSLTYRPTIDLNSYFILSLNNDATISVIDPILGIAGITQLYSMIYLKRPGEDWALSGDEKTLYVTMPRAGQVAVASTENFKVLQNIDAGVNPGRIVLQPDGKYLWVGNDSPDPGEGGVTVIDTVGLTVVARIPTGRGEHEVAFSDDSLTAYVTNSLDGTLSVINVQELKKVRDVKTGPHPLSVAFSSLGKAVYAASRDDGTITVIDAKTGNTSQIRLEPGLGMVRFSPGGRWGVAINRKSDTVTIFDSSNNRVVHTATVGKDPHQITFTKDYVYIRCRGTADFYMIQLSKIGRDETLPVVKIPGGQRPPGDSRFDSVAPAIFPSPEEGHVLITNPADGMILYYMEGMNVSMGSFRSYGGHVPRAVRVIDRTLREKEKGVYTASVRIPASGAYQVAFLLDAPRIIHCFEFTAKPNPMIGKERGKPSLELLTAERDAAAGDTFRLRFRVTEGGTGRPLDGIDDMVVQATYEGGLLFERHPARGGGDGVYEALIPLRTAGSYYMTFHSPSLKVSSRDLPSLMIQARQKAGDAR